MNMRFLPFAAVAALLLTVPAAAPAQSPTGEITVHVSAKRIALAVAPLSGSPAFIAPMNATLEHTLQLTGLFDAVPSGSFLPGLSSESMAQTDYTKWFASGAAAVIKGEISPNGSLDIGLFDVTQNKRIDLPIKTRAVNDLNYKKAVYDFVNAVVAYYTGAPGFFGQSLLAVARDGRGKSARVVSMTTDGDNITRVSRGNAIEMLPAWGPDGKILLTSYAKGNPDLYIVSNGAGKRIASFPGMNSGAAYCSANGRIALTLSKDGNAEIYTMNPDGSSLSRLTNNRAIDTSPAWSPDCSKIVFVSDRGGNPQLYTMNADGSAQSRLTTVGKYNANPDWGKNGQIAFTGRDETGNLDIFIIRDDGSDLTRITQQQGRNDQPTWSPDGRYLAFASTRDGSSRIYISTADGKSQSPATTSGWFENPVWGH